MMAEEVTITCHPTPKKKQLPHHYFTYFYKLAFIKAASFSNIQLINIVLQVEISFLKSKEEEQVR
jgi:hypothetical protein